MNATAVKAMTAPLAASTATPTASSFPPVGAARQIVMPTTAPAVPETVA
jgi:hypothetical protein